MIFVRGVTGKVARNRNSCREVCCLSGHGEILHSSHGNSHSRSGKSEEKYYKPGEKESAFFRQLDFIDPLISEGVLRGRFPGDAEGLAAGCDFRVEGERLALAIGHCMFDYGQETCYLVACTRNDRRAILEAYGLCELCERIPFIGNVPISIDRVDSMVHFRVGNALVGA